MDTFDHCNWAVCFDTPAATQDDKKPKRTVCAWFAYPFDANEYIDKILPAENRSRFYVIYRTDIYQ